MLVNIIDSRDNRNEHNDIEAVIEPMYHNGVRPDGTFVEETDDDFICEWKNHLSVKEAIEWANELKFEAELFLYNIGGSGFDGTPTHGSEKYNRQEEKRKAQRMLNPMRELIVYIDE